MKLRVKYLQVYSQPNTCNVFRPSNKWGVLYFSQSSVKLYQHINHESRVTEWCQCVRILFPILMPKSEKEDQRYDQKSLFRPIPRRCTRSSVHAILCTVSRRTVSNLRVRSRTAGTPGYYNTYSTLYSSIRVSMRANDVQEAHRNERHSFEVHRKHKQRKQFFTRRNTR